ncbi:MAG: sugar phosphate isomerase/epimerase [Treponema sp.]|nr:sugar phosphate isomerase/epimerase [Treponema sp.]
MKKGINAWSIPSMPVREKVLLAKKAGFEGIELTLGEDGEISLKTPDKDFLELKTYIKDNGMKISGLATGLYWKYSFMSNSAEERKKAAETAVRQIEAANLLETGNILLLPGTINDSVDYETGYNRAQEEIQKLIPTAKANNIRIGIENVWNKFLLSPLEARTFVDNFKSEYIGFYFDAGNVILFGYAEHWIKILGKRIINVHFKDFNRSANAFVDLLAGDVNYIEVVKELEAAGYNGWVNVETGGYNQYSDQIVYNSSAAMDRILSKN